MSFPGSIYAPPGVYTQTNYEDPLAGLAASLRLPLILGPGSEILVQNGLEVVRGSSSSVDQKIVGEDEDSRAVVSISDVGLVTLGAFDGALDRIQVRNYPIVTGAGSGTTSTKTSDVSVTINGQPVVVLKIDGSSGVLTLSTPPVVTDEVRVTYFFNRTDTLITDIVSDQISSDAPMLYGSKGENFVVVEGVNNTLSFTVDSAVTVDVTITSSPTIGYTTAQIAAFINAASSAASSTLVAAGTVIDSFGNTVLSLTADSDVLVGSGTANTLLGLTAGVSTARNTVFYVFQRPIVDGSNEGTTTNIVSDVTVEVDNVQVVPTSVDGRSGAVTLPYAPAVGAVVTVKYYFNSWQNTFDYLAHRGILGVTSCGYTANTPDFISGVDFVLQDDKILWGAASLITAGAHTSGSDYFDDTQITSTLVDTRSYLTPCAAVVDTTVNPAVENRVDFRLPLQATTGNGKNSPLGTDTFLEVSNGRRDWPTDRPDLIFAYWGYSVEDALDRGRVEVTKVASDTNKITLREPVPVGAYVYATFYYNTLVDSAYTLSVVTAAGSGSGTYSIAGSGGEAILTPTFGTKSAALATVSINFPSGSEAMPDCRFETPFTTTSYTGPVSENVTVTFAAQDATLAKYTVPSSGPYYAVAGSSDHFDLEVDNAALGAGFVDLSAVNSGESVGFLASLVGHEIVYDADTSHATYAITAANNSIGIIVDGVQVAASAVANAAGTVADYVTALNAATLGIHGTGGAASGVATIEIAAAQAPSDVADYYVDWELRCHTGTGSAATIRTVTAYDGADLLTLDGGTFDATSEYHLYNPAAAPVIKSRPMKGTFIIDAGNFDDFRLNVVDASGPLALNCTIGAATYTSLSDLAVAVQAAILTAIGGPTVNDPTILVSSNSNNELELSYVPDPAQSTGGYLEFVDGATSAADFSRLAGFDTAAASTGQMKLANIQIARRFTFAGTSPTGNLAYDRLMLQNRILPGQAGSIGGEYPLSQCSLSVQSGTGLTECGVSANDWGAAGIRGTMLPSYLEAQISRDGVDSTGGTEEPYVTLNQSGGTSTQNNELSFTVDGTTVSFALTDSAGAAIDVGASADVNIGPMATANTILNQIQTAMTGLGLGAAQISQLGVGFALRGASVAASAAVSYNGGNANAWLSISEGSASYRTDLEPRTLASALQGHEATISGATLDWSSGSTATYFPAVALATGIKDGANKSYVFLQSQGVIGGGAGTVSSLAFTDAATDSVTRPGVGLGVVSGDGNVGEAAIEGFVVQSSDLVSGSGTANTSPFAAGTLTAGIGQAGEVGQTYRDAVTGLTFSVLPRDGGSVYPTGSSFTLQVSENVVCDANVPVNSIPGIELSVSNTLGITPADTAIVTTYIPGGAEPVVGDSYWITYTYSKSDFSAQVFTKMSSVEAAFGAKGVNYPVSLAAYLAFLNGAVVVAIKQVQMDTDTDSDGVSDSVSYDGYLAAIDDVEGPLPGGAFPDILVPLKGDSLTLYQYLARHCDVQSSIRYRAERTAICGTSAGTQPQGAGAMAEGIARTRLRLIYPDIYTLTLTTFDGTDESYLVDGTYMAAALAGNRAAPAIDVATPWTGARLIGFDKVSRRLDAVQENQVAVRGISVISQNLSVIKVRQGLSTDMSNVLTKTPTVVTIADEVQRQSRATLGRFIGQKFLSGVTSQIESQLSATLKSLAAQNIIAAFTGVSATVSPEDPTVAEVEAFYQPVFPLLYIVCTFNMRSTL